MKDVMDIIQKTLASAAILAAGFWFLFRYEYLPKANISQGITTACYGTGIRWVRIDTTVENRGNARLILGRHRHRLSSVLPVGRPDLESLRGKIVWPELASLEINSDQVFLENNETQVLYFDFLIPDQVTMVESTAWFENMNVRNPDGNFGWIDISLFSDLGGLCA